ncbi:MAG: hypothetical protein O2857_04755 [Planctomycetota bacterium]|nr:hypothetical protein [Planctomycetota bacterium]
MQISLRKQFSENRDVHACLTLAGLALLFFAEALCSPSSVLYSSFSDIINQRMAWQEHLRRGLLLHGEIPLWYPNIFSGVVFVGEPECWAFYPLNWPLLLLPSNISILWMIVLHLMLGGVGCYGYLRWSRQLDIWPSMMGGLVFMFGGKCLLHVLVPGHTGFLGLAWVPFCLWMIDNICRDPRPKSACLLAICLGMIGLSMHPQIAFYLPFLLVGYFLLRLLENEHKLKRCILFAVAGILAGAISSPQILPALEVAGMSARKVYSNTGFSSVGSLGWRDIVDFLRPGVSPESLPMQYWAGDTWVWEKAFFLGLLPIACAPLCYASKSRRDILYFALVGLSCVVYSLGEAGGLFSAVNKVIPGFSLFRGPARPLFILSTILPFILAYGLQVFWSDCENLKRLLAAGIGCLAPAMLLIWIEKGFSVAVLFLSAFYCSGLVLRVKSERKHLAAALITVAFVIESWSFLYPQIQLREVDTLYGSPLLASLPDSIGERERVAEHNRQIVGTMLPEYLLVRFGLKDINGYNPVLSARYVEFMSKVTGKEPKPEVWIPDLIPAAKHRLLDHLSLALRYEETDEGPRPVRAETALPFVYVVPQSVYLDPADILQRLADETHDPRMYVVLERKSEEPPRSVETTKDPPRSVETTGGEPYRALSFASYSPNKVRVNVSLKKPGYVVMNEAWHPGWKCQDQNGAQQEVLRANFLFRAVRLGPGEHELLFRFEPASYVIGKWASLLGILLAAGIASWRWFRRGSLEWQWIQGVAAVSLLLLVAVVFRWKIPFAGEYAGRYAIDPQWGGMTFPFILVLLMAALVWGSLKQENEWALEQRNGWRVTGLLLILAGLKFLLHFSTVMFLHEFSLAAAVWPFIQRLGDGAYNVAASQITSLGHFLETFQWRFLESERDPLLPHLETHPPGPTLFFYGIIQFLDVFEGLRHWLETTALNMSPVLRDTLGEATTRQSNIFRFPLGTALGASLLCYLLAAISVPLVYLLSREFCSRKPSFVIAAFTALFPGDFSYNPGLDQTFGTLAVLMVWLAVKAVKTRQWYFGAIFGFTTFISIGTTLAFIVPLGMLFWSGIFILYSLHRESRLPDWREFVPAVIGAAGGLFIPIILLAITCKFNLISVLHLCYKNNAEWHKGYGNKYWPWALSNLGETLYSMGPAASISLLIFALMKLREFARSKTIQISDAFYWGITFTFFLLCALAVNRGEVGRLWLFLFPLLWAGVAPASERGHSFKLEPEQFNSACLLFMCLQGISVLVITTGTDALEISKTFYNVMNKFGG